MNRNPKGRRGGRNRQNFSRKGTNGPKGASPRMNNMDYESSDTDKSAVSENLGSNYTCTDKNYGYTAVNENANPFERNLSRFSEKGSEEPIKEISPGLARNSKPIDMLRNFTPEEQLHKNFDTSDKQNVNVQSNVSSFDPTRGINDIRDLTAQLEALKQKLDPSSIINDCRVKVISETELCTANHGKKIVKISSEIPKTDGKDKIILEKHLANMNLQLKSFQQFVQEVFSDLSELYLLNGIDEILNRTNEIISRVEVECKRFSKNLPAYSLKNDIEMALEKGQVTVISCDAVYFGNTVIPLLIQNMANFDGLIACCEVNDVLALSSAKSCASLNDQLPGHLVGYEVGKESIVSQKVTKIIYTTVQELFSYGLEDPQFSRFSCIFVNEFFRRSIEADTLLASLRECLSTRKDLKLLLLVSEEQTALNIEKYFSKMVSTSLVRTENLILPVQVIWKETPCNSEDDFITEAADMCLAVHVLNGDGSILVFLPSSEDALKASALTASKLLEYSFKDAHCVHVSDKTKGKKCFQITEQKQGMRTIIFTHDGFESVMFPNVRYVIDSGRIKDLCFDSQKKLEVRRTSFISRARAKIRRNCAGRSSSGVCYRMYSKADYVRNMACNELPELLTKSPLNSMVKIFQYKPDTALTVEFIEPFSEQVKENALRSLRSLGALKNEKLTLLGERIIKLPFLPKYSKLIILGIQWGIPFEAIVIVSLFLVKGYFFEYRNTEEFKKKVDAAKLHFLINDSDTLTFLNIYKQWTENALSKSWCADNCIDFTVLENVYTKVNEVCDIVYKNMDAKDIDRFSDDFKWSSLQEVIFECFKDNLCVYTGHFLSGYRSLAAQCIVFLHPSNSIPRKENLPQFIVYDRCISKSRNFVTHITSVPEALVTKALRSGLLEAREHDLFERKLVPRVVDCVGDMIIKHVFKKEKLRELEEQIKNKTKSELIVIEPSVEKGNVTLYALPDSIEKAEAVMRKILQENVEHFRNETETLTLELRYGNSIAPVGISWSSGGKISSVTIGTRQNPYNKPRSDLFDRSSISSPEESATHSCIHLSWLRRPCEGFGYVGFDKSDFSKARRLGMTTIQVKGYDANVQINKKRNNQLFVTGLHPETTDFDLKEGIQESLEEDVPIASVNVILCSPFETHDSEIQEIEKLLKKLCQELLQTFVVEVKANKPKKEDIMMTAEVKVRSGSNLEAQAAVLNSRLRMGELGVKAKPIYYSNLFCNVKVLKALESRIQASLKKFEHELRNDEVNSDDELFRLEADTHDYLTAKLKLSAYNEKIITSLRKIVQNLLEGDIITSNDVSCIHKLFCHGGHLWLETLEKSENIHIIDEYKSKTIRLYGTPPACHNAKLRINKFLSSVEEEAVKHIVLSDGKDSRILLKAIIQEYGVDLKNFIYCFGLRSAELDIRKCQLTLHGSADSIQKAEDELEKLADDFDSKCLTEIQSNQEICPVCLCPALTLTFRLENCGHLYCDTCIKGLLSDVQIPLQCCAEGCGKELILEDIRKVLDYDAGKIEELQMQSLKDYIVKNRNFVYCPSPDCTMFVDKEKFYGTKWNCPLCHNDICIPCNTIYHHGFSCDVYQGSKLDSDYSFKVWKKTASNCKICPNCKSAIEKTHGCNHMTCSSCGTHFCWLCQKAFRTGTEVYNHLPYCPNNQGR